MQLSIRTSKHIGVISEFDREFVKTGKIDKRFSAILHDAFDDRLECDYKEFVELSIDDATVVSQWHLYNIIPHLPVLTKVGNAESSLDFTGFPLSRE
jgi:uncharacterized protein (UPF0332 family)